ncbi:hypothetical protein I5G58_gp072 [Mycobacterium phage BirdsNest]|uniref:Ribbon-helix-helix DNA binding domain protein n=1 Tax=Mycobacterium phage BirdsNest TaxID=2686231 RepID=A0A6B9LHR8_9CAUD|nr:hypothetical protein I5G58_gp072 [Mycobacterium phage BirdsNest]QHB37374.1 hypothetical protein PBI_BIRDSNEST_72 [Mycobacterium phage BirdsNest]
MAGRGGIARDTLVTMPTTQRPAETRPVPTKPIQVKGMTDDLIRRFKVAAAEEGTSYAGLIEQWLDARDRAAERQRARQAHPLHRPRQEATA